MTSKVRVPVAGGQLQALALPESQGRVEPAFYFQLPLIIRKRGLPAKSILRLSCERHGAQMSEVLDQSRKAACCADDEPLERCSLLLRGPQIGRQVPRMKVSCQRATADTRVEVRVAKLRLIHAAQYPGRTVCIVGGK